VGGGGGGGGGGGTLRHEVTQAWEAVSPSRLSVVQQKKSCFICILHAVDNRNHVCG